MHMGQVIGFFAIIPATILLVISFFVLLALKKVESETFKAFGYVIVVLLWIDAAMLLGLGMYKIISGKSVFIPHVMTMSADKYGMMKGRMMGGMMQGKMMDGMMQGKMMDGMAKDKMECSSDEAMMKDSAPGSKTESSGKSPMQHKM